LNILFQNIYKKTPDTWSEVDYLKKEIVRSLEMLNSDKYKEVSSYMFRKIGTEPIGMTMYMSLKLNNDNLVATYMYRYPGTHDKPMMFKIQNFPHPYKFMQDNVKEESYGISSSRNNILFKTFMNYVEKLFESGITQTFKSIKYTNFKEYEDLFEIYEPSIGLAPLNMTMLEAGFVIWLVAVGISLLVFIGEILIFYFSNFIKKHQSKHETKIASFVKKKKTRIVKVRQVQDWN
jgi:hypothetical protein